MNIERIVGIVTAEKPWTYPRVPPFLPDEEYPELRARVQEGKERNAVYSLFRRLMHYLGMDKARFGTPEWNPFSEIVRPGQRVLIKPNLVRHLHLGGGDLSTVVTHASLVRCVLDYVALALGRSGEITIGDAPLQSADFAKIITRTGLREVCDDVSERWHVPVRLMDFRLRSVTLDVSHRVTHRQDHSGDPNGYIPVNLGNKSLLQPISMFSERFRVTNYDSKEMIKHHREGHHEYLIPRTVINADVVINLPKLKTHRKVGLTGALKNMVGINGHKDWLPHHRYGSLPEGGDEYCYPSFLKRVRTHIRERIDRNPLSAATSFLKMGERAATLISALLCADQHSEGSWYGNDTLWRTVLDLNRLLIYADKVGIMRDDSQRRCLTVVDAIIAGEGEGPMEPDPLPCGMLIGGSNPTAVDSVLAVLAGFDFRSIPLIFKAFEITEWPLVSFKAEDIRVRDSTGICDILKFQPQEEHAFKAASGWMGHIESKLSDSNASSVSIKR